VRYLLISSLLFVSLAHAQKPAPDLAADAVSHLLENLKQEAHYTFVDTEHDLSYIDGKFNEEKTTLSETIELEGLPYTRHLQINGKPLSGKALAREQQFYEQAIKERRSVSDVRAEGHKTSQHTSLNVLNRLTIDFTNRVIGHESMDGHACVQLLFEPKPGVSPAPTKKFILWVDVATHDVLRSDQELLVTENNLLPGSVFSTRFAPVDGVLLEKQFVGDFSWNEAMIHNKLVHLVATHDYTNYRRFRTTVTISPASEPQ
jgi:hypothetical protein